MLVIKELIYFMFALFLLVALMCLIVWSGWLLNTLFKEWLDIDIVETLKTRAKEKKKGDKNEVI